MALTGIDLRLEVDGPEDAVKCASLVWEWLLDNFDTHQLRLVGGRIQGIQELDVDNWGDLVPKHQVFGDGT